MCAVPVTVNLPGDTFVSYLNPLRLHFSGSFEAAVSPEGQVPPTHGRKASAASRRPAAQRGTRRAGGPR
jgi:hypothetical protein